jgi:hypothetical protein
VHDPGLIYSGIGEWRTGQDSNPIGPILARP